MRSVEKLAAFVVRARNEDVSKEARHLLKRNVLDSIACAIGALDGPPLREVRSHIETFGGQPLATLVGGGKTSPDQAAFYNTALTHYLGFMDSFLGLHELAHPSDNLGALLAAAEYERRSGLDLLTALAVAYDVQGSLIARLPILRSGLSHTTPLALSVAAGASRLLGLSENATADALAIAAASALEPAAVLAEPLSAWSGLAPADAASRALRATFLAGRGISGPRGIFEGPFGLDSVLGDTASLEWPNGPLDKVWKTALARFDANVLAQTAIEAAIELRESEHLRPEKIAAITVKTVRDAYDLLGGGAYGEKKQVDTREQAGNDLAYLVAVALLDGKVGKAELGPERIHRDDVQKLLAKVTVKPSLLYSFFYPERLPASVTVALTDGRKMTARRATYDGFPTRPMTWAKVVSKLDRLAEPHADADLRALIVATTAELERGSVADLLGLLAEVRPRARETTRETRAAA